MIMKVSELIENLNLTLFTDNIYEDREVKGCYIGDLLSWVMGRASENSAWVTVMGNINAVAVAVLADISCIVLAENSTLDDEAKIKANEHDIPVIQTDIPQFELCVDIDKLIK